MATITLPAFNPYAGTNAAGSFNVDSEGYVQGQAIDQPAIRNSLMNGILAGAETLPMYGGVGIYAQIPAPGTSTTPGTLLGPYVGRATTVTKTSSTGLVAFSVFDQNYSAVNNPQNPVPLVGTYGNVSFYLLGSGAIIPVAVDPSLASLESGSIAQQVSWDFTNQRLQPYDASTTTYAISTATWANTNGGTLTIVTSAAVPFGLGDTITISGATNSGTGGAAAINTSFVIASFTDSEHFTLTAPAAAGVFGTIAGSPVVTAGTGALAVNVLRIQTTKCMTVLYNASAGTYTWNRNDAVALIQI